MADATQCFHCDSFARKGDSREELGVHSKPSDDWARVDAHQAFISSECGSLDVVALPDGALWDVRVYYLVPRPAGQTKFYPKMCPACLKTLIGRVWALMYYR